MVRPHALPHVALQGGGDRHLPLHLRDPVQVQEEVRGEPRGAEEEEAHRRLRDDRAVLDEVPPVQVGALQLRDKVLDCRLEADRVHHAGSRRHFVLRQSRAQGRRRRHQDTKVPQGGPDVRPREARQGDRGQPKDGEVPPYRARREGQPDNREQRPVDLAAPAGEELQR